MQKVESRISRLVFLFIGFLMVQQLFAAGPVCFNYEMHEHQNLMPVGLNRALANYPHGTIVARNGIIPALGIGGAHSVGISLMNALGPLPMAWQHAVPILGGALTLQEACQMAIDRESLGIRVEFQEPLALAFTAAGGIPFAAGILGIPVGNLIAYLHRALGGGGYLTPIATGIYRLRHNFPPPNYLLLAGMIPAIADTVMIHFHDVRRISKNIKELSYNSILNPAIPGMPPYISLKDMIDAQYAVLGLPIPDSGTTISADMLQLD
ncbi:hypothetical protein ID47_06090 [Candidatus Paracaedibacter acanthamoebae]|uniref:Uncharacterized protein n=2 Tax=Candidatus Odyssella acanthamoebae TaxID=91604 RepID=A0A077AXP1_9PROT|nr:hypothetical protein ID47_06090 [Candidatus Paracaedibacter acanthamoebae]